MLSKLRYRLRILPVLLLLSVTGLAQSRDSLRFLHNTLHLNLAPGAQQEVQLSYERALNSHSSLEVVVSGRLPSSEHWDGRSFGMYILAGSYEDRVYGLSYENSFGAGMHLKGSLSPGKRRGFIPFASPGILYRYSFFDNKCYGESHAKKEDSFGQEFSLRKHEVSARLMIGVRHHIYLRGGKSAFSTEASLGFGAAKRFGKFLDVRRYYGSSGCPPDTWLGRPIEPRTRSFNANVVTVPINLKIGYSWGG